MKLGNAFFLLVTLVLMVNRFVVGKKVSSNRLHKLSLDHDRLTLKWLIDWNNQEVLFYVQNAFATGNKWFSLGFSSRGLFGKSDFCFFVKENNVFNVVLDTYSSEDGQIIHKDKQQDCLLIRMDDSSIAFKRKFDTCDTKDLRMHEGTMYIMWSRGSDPIDTSRNFFPTPNVSMHDQGMHMSQLLRADIIKVPEKNFKLLEIVLDKVKIPAQETTYWCKVQKLGAAFKEKRHIVEFEPIIKNPAFVHHMEVFHCVANTSTEIPLYNGDCNLLPEAAKVCSKVVALWAMGAGTFTYPLVAGLPIGGPDYNPYIRLEVHFNNPMLDAGNIDSSGMRLKYVTKLRQYDAGVMELGLEYTDKMAIPPGQLAFPLSGYCISECTNIALPKEGIVVFGSQLHTHLRGVRVLTRHFRDGDEMRELNRDDYYSHHFQEIRQLRRKTLVLPGDALVTTCYYDTRGYTNTTLGGFSISDEMCVNYIHYYPATNLELCKSAVSENSLFDFFQYMKIKEHQTKVQIGGARSSNYQAIEWTQPRVDELYTMYVQEPLSMSCNRSDGAHFAGYSWEGTPVTEVRIKSPKWDKSKCKSNGITDTTDVILERGECDVFGDCIY